MLVAHAEHGNFPCASSARGSITLACHFPFFDERKTIFIYWIYRWFRTSDVDGGIGDGMSEPENILLLSDRANYYYFFRSDSGHGHGVTHRQRARKGEWKSISNIAFTSTRTACPLHLQAPTMLSVLFILAPGPEFFFLFCFPFFLSSWVWPGECVRPLTAFNFLMVENAVWMIEAEAASSGSAVNVIQFLWCCIRLRPSSIECSYRFSFIE